MKTDIHKNETDSQATEKDFSLLSAVVLVILMLTFLSSSVYIMMSSLP